MGAKKYFHVSDSSKSRLSPGMVLKPLVPTFHFLKSFCPEGVSFFGNDIMTLPIGNHIGIIEVVFELVRARQFPDRPSRLNCIFAFESPEDADRFVVIYRKGSPGLSLWEVEGEGFKADMNLLRSAPSFNTMIEFAQLYWSGQPGPNPWYEILLPFPVRVVRHIKNY